MSAPVKAHTAIVFSYQLVRKTIRDRFESGLQDGASAAGRISEKVPCFFIRYGAVKRKESFYAKDRPGIR